MTIMNPPLPPRPPAHDEAPPPDAEEPAGPPLARKGSFVRTARAVAWSFLGIRRSKGLEEDSKHLNPLHVVVAGVLGAALFVMFLVALVHWVTSPGVTH
jgi:hypothetical protein